MALVTGRGAQHESLEASDVAAAAVRVGEPGFLAGRLVWVVTPPSGPGNAVVVSCARGETPRRESPADDSVRSRLYGYGAASWCASPVGLVGVESRTQRLCRLSPERLEPVGVPAPADVTDRLGDPACVPATSWVICVRERHDGAATRVALVAIEVTTGECVELHEVDGLAAEPAIDVAGRRVAWLRWPWRTMPWDGAELWVGDLDFATSRPAIRSPRRLDGGRACSAGQPTWLPDGSLVYVTEGAGRWQPWRCDPSGAVQRLCGAHVEFQRPRWTTCRWLADGPDASLVCAFADADGEHVATLGLDGSLETIDQPCVRVDAVAADDTHVAWVGATTQEQGTVLMASRARSADLCSLPAWDERSACTSPPRVTVAAPEPTSFTFVHDGAELSGVRWAPSTDRAALAPAPLVVTVHPGPTGATDRSYTPLAHLLCSNGFAVASIDYSGSTAHGRQHRERLTGRYGELDVAECTAAAAHLVDAALADERALFIRGTSAGGTTALLALCGGTFAGAAAWYPASSFDDDPDDEYRFESGYLGTLLGAAGASRSPVERAESMSGSVLIVQGEDDDVVDPAQTERLVARLREHLADVTSVVVKGEGHGFRTAAGRALALGHELAFYRRLTVARTGRDARYDSTPSGATEQPGPP